MDSGSRGENLEIQRANISPEPLYQWGPEAVLDGEYRLSCGAVAEPVEHAGYYLRAPKFEKTASKTQTATIDVTYEGDGWNSANGDSAKVAFGRAVSTWETLLTSNQTIQVTARFDSLSPGVLGSAGPCNYYCPNVFNIPQTGNTLLMSDALIDAFFDFNFGGASCDISANFSNQYPNFHFGPGPPPSGTYDFETVVAHELGHGLNFAGLASVTFDTTFTDPPDNTIIDHVDTTSTFFRGACPAFLGVSVWNLYTEDGNAPALAAAKTDDLLAAMGVSLVDTASYPDASALLASALMGQQGGVFWADTLVADTLAEETAAYVANGSVRPPLYSPAPWQGGSSYSHLNDADFNGTTDNMMTHALGLAEMGRGPGPVSCGIMSDVGWEIDAGACAGISLPVELIAFDVTIDNGSGLVRWTTATEDDNAGFEVEMRSGDEPWTSLGFVEGAGRSTLRLDYEFRIDNLGYGKHSFRLKQVDFDGSFVYSYEVEAVKAVPGQFVLSEAYPNPFNPATNLNLVVGRTQEVAVELFDIAGRKVSTIMREKIGENEQRVVRIDGATLPSGVYVVRVVGDNFIANRRIVLLK